MRLRGEKECGSLAVHGEEEGGAFFFWSRAQGEGSFHYFARLKVAIPWPGRR